MSDEINYLPLPPEAKRYARRKGLRAMQRQPQDFIDAVAAVTNQKDKQYGFRNSESLARQIVDALLCESFVAWHASPNRFKKFDCSREGAHFGTREQADNLRKSGLKPARPYLLDIKNPLRVPDIGTWTVDGIAYALYMADVTTEEENDAVYAERNWSDERGYAKIKEILAAKGYDGFVYRNEQEGEGDSWVAFYPQQIKPYRGEF
jgi:hypothetical protein